MNFERFIIISIILLFSLSVGAYDFEPKGPLTLRNQNPIYLEFLNIEPTRAQTLPKGELAFRVDNAFSNTFERGIGDNNDVLLDMETLRTAFHLDVGVYEGMEVGVEVPFLRLDTGFLDASLQKYHTTFGFPNAGRERVPNGGFTYRFNRNGTALYEVPTQENFGLGDITLNFKHNFWEEERLRPAVAWLFYLKLPTGDRGEGLGSGNPDFGFGTAFEKNYRRWHGYLNLAYFVSGGHASLQNYVYDQYFSYVVGGEYSISRPISIVAQIYGGSPLLKNTGMPQWDWVPLDLQIGLKGDIVQRWFKGCSKVVWQLGFSEDLNANGPSIDFTILGSVGFRY